MGKITSIDRTAHFAWSPANHNSVLFAAGSSGTSSSIDAAISDKGTLEIFHFNPADLGKPSLRGSAALDEKIFQLKWSPLTSTYDQTSPAGILVAGVEGGIIIHSVDKILKNQSDTILKQAKTHTGIVHAIDISPSLPNLLATGAADSEVFVWDLNVPDHCIPFRSYPLECCENVAWNQRISYIFASAFCSRCVLWDLRKSDAIIKLGDQNSRIRYKNVSWNPEIATQLALSSQDDHEPVVQVWDLRNGSAPLFCLEGHSRGVVSIDWCPHDADILLSAGKDGNVYAWNVNESSAGEIIFALPQSKQWAFEVSWCPRIPSVFGASYYDNKLDICSVIGGREELQATDTHSKLSESFPGMSIGPLHEVSDNRFGESIRKAPKWFRRPGCCSFSFDGKLVKSVSENGIMGLEIGRPVCDHDFIDRATVLEKHLNSYQEREYCDMRILAEDSPVEREEWNFIKACFQPDSLLPLLGYHSEIVTKTSHENGQPSKEQSPNRGFSSFRIQTGKDIEGNVSRALLAGNLELAVDLCLRHQREAEAIMLSLSKTSGHLPELFRQTQDLFFASKSSNLSQLIRVIVKKDMQFLIEQCQPEDWREVIAVLLNYGESKELPTLMQLLGDRLQSESANVYRRSCVICYICAGNIDKMVEVWLQSSPKNSQEAASSIQSTMEKTLIALRAFGSTGLQASYGSQTIDLFQDYAFYLAEQGELGMALRFVNTDNSARLNKLKHRLYTCVGPRAALSEAGMHSSPLSLSITKDLRRTSSQPVSPSWSGPFKSHHSFSPMVIQPTSVHPLLGAPYNQPFSSVRYGGEMPHSNQLHQPFSSGWSFSEPPQNEPAMSSVSKPPGLASFHSPFSPPTALEPRATLDAAAFSGFYDPTSFSRQPTLSNSFDQLPTPPASYQNIKTSGGWNDPPPLLLINRRPSNPPAMTTGASPMSVPLPPHMLGMPDNQSVMGHHGPPFSLHHHAPPTAMAQSSSSVMYSSMQSESSTVHPMIETVKEKVPIPPELLPISEGFHQILKHFRDVAVTGGDAHTVRRLDDVTKKLDLMDDCLRNHTLSETVINQLHLIVHNLQVGDPSQALNVHAHLASQGLFAEVGSFLPGVKVLLQLCQRAPG